MCQKKIRLRRASYVRAPPGYAKGEARRKPCYLTYATPTLQGEPESWIIRLQQCL